MKTELRARLPLNLARHLDSICQKFEAAWKTAVTAGPRPLIEDYLSQSSAAERVVLLSELVVLDIHYRRLYGEDPKASDYRGRFPQADLGWLAEELNAHPAANGQTLIPGCSVASSGTAMVDRGRAADTTVVPETREQPYRNEPGAEPVPGFRLVKRLGSGHFGEVWETHAPGGVRVALKLIPLENHAGRLELRALEIIKDVRHPNLLSLFGAWQLNGLLVIGMELAECTLWDRFQQAVKEGLRGIPPSELLRYCSEAARIIDYLNKPRHLIGAKRPVGIQHCDIKPQNLLLVGGGLKVGDFGLVQSLRGQQRTGVKGMTVAFGAPEMFHGAISRWSDQYSLAITYCYLRSGGLPFTGDVNALCDGHLFHSPNLTMLSESERPLVARALAKNPSERWPNCRTFVRGLIECSRRRRKAPAFDESADFRLIEADATSPLETASATLGLLDWQVQEVRNHPDFQRLEASWRSLCDQLVPIEEINRQLAHAAPTLTLTVPNRLTGSGTLTFQFSFRQLNDFAAAALRLQVTSQVPTPRSEIEIGEQISESLPHTLFRTRGVRPVALGSAVVSSQQPAGLLSSWQAHSDGVWAAAFVPDESGNVLSGAADGTIALWNYLGQELGRFRGHTEGVTALAVSGNGKQLLSSSLDGTLRLWDMADRTELKQLDGERTETTSLAVSPCGRYALSGGRDGAAAYWDLLAGKQVRTLHGHGDWVQAVALWPDGCHAVTGGKDRTVRIWDINSGRELRRWDAHAAWVNGVAVSPDGRTVLSASGGPISGGADFSLRLWDADSGKQLRCLTGHNDWVRSVAISPDGSQALSGSDDDTVRLWSLTMGQEIACFEGHTWSVLSVGFSPDGRRGLSASDDGTVRLWNLPH